MYSKSCYVSNELGDHFWCRFAIHIVRIVPNVPTYFLLKIGIRWFWKVQEPNVESGNCLRDYRFVWVWGKQNVHDCPCLLSSGRNRIFIHKWASLRLDRGCFLSPLLSFVRRCILGRRGRNGERWNGESILPLEALSPSQKALWLHCFLEKWINLQSAGKGRLHELLSFREQPLGLSGSSLQCPLCEADVMLPNILNAIASE